MSVEIKTIEGVLIPSDKRDQPEYLARMFCELLSDGQAEFLDHVAKIANTWGGLKGTQWLYIKKEASDDALKLIEELYEYMVQP